MKRAFALILAAIMLASALVSCAALPTATSALIRTTSSDAADAAAWLADRLGEKLTDRVVLGTSADGYALDLSALEDDGYIIRALGGETALFARTANGLDRAVRRYAKRVESGAAIADETYHEGRRVESLTIAGNDVSEYAIVVPDGASANAKSAASTLANYVKAACGASLPQYTGSEYEAAGVKPARRIVFTEGDGSLGDEGYRITVDGSGDLHIDGGVYRGCLWAAYGLAEDIGWRFTSADFFSADKSEYLYESDSVDLTAAINRTEIPSIPIRGGCGRLGQRNTYSANTYGYAIRAGHGLESAHNQIFSGEFAGLYAGPKVEGTQPCFSNEDILEAIDNYALNYVRSRLDAGQTIGKELCAIDVAQYDTDRFCTCKKCTALSTSEASLGAPLLKMVNRVAALMDENYPGMEVSFLAYWGADVLPRTIRPAHNVLVAFAFYIGAGDGFIACSNHCISGEDCDMGAKVTNAVPAKRFEEWEKVIDPAKFQIWYYPLQSDNYAYPIPILMTLYKDIRYLAEHKVGHVYLCSGMQTNGNVLTELWRYLCAKVAWNADMSEDEYVALIREWFDIMYGDAGADLFALAMLAEAAGDAADCWCGFHYLTHDRVNFEYLSRCADEIFDSYDRVRSLAGSAYDEELVERYMAGMLFMAVESVYESRFVEGDEAQRAELTAWYRTTYDLFRKYSLPIYTHLGMYYCGMPDGFDPSVEPGRLVVTAFEEYVG